MLSAIPVSAKCNLPMSKAVLIVRAVDKSCMWNSCSYQLRVGDEITMTSVKILHLQERVDKGDDIFRQELL